MAQVFLGRACDGRKKIQIGLLNPGSVEVYGRYCTLHVAILLYRRECDRNTQGPHSEVNTFWIEIDVSTFAKAGQ